MGMRGHTLAWHNQTPRWFFTERYSRSPSAPLAGRETMLARLDSYIRQVIGFAQKEYPGIVYAWDVVNEAVDNGKMRPSLWTKRWARISCCRHSALRENTLRPT